MHVNDLDTPALTIDLEILERNIARMAAHCRDLDIALRPHTKTHKIPEIAHRQMAAGAIGITCQKLGEAEVMVLAGLTDVLIPYNIVGSLKLERLTRLVRRATITVAADSEETVQGLAHQAQKDGCTIRVIVELSIGSRRCGVPSPQAALSLAQTIAASPGLDFQGIMTYPSSERAGPFIAETVELLHQAGLPVPIISGGGTGAEATSKQIGCTETRSGSYVFEGMRRVNNDTLNPETCPLRMICTVVSTPAPDRAIIDGGAKTFTSYPPTPYGYILEDPQVKINGMSVEHGHLDVTEASRPLRVGDRLSVIPAHGGMTTNLHDEVYGVRDGSVEVIWPVAGRGKVR